MEGWLWAFAGDATEIRRFDFSLGEDQVSLRDRFSEFFTQECPSSLVRAAEPLGFDRALWQKAAERGLPSLRLSEDKGGGGASAVDLTLVAEEAGRVAAPLPFAETPITVPLLALCADDGAQPRLDAAVDGSYISTLALRPLTDASPSSSPRAPSRRGSLRWTATSWPSTSRSCRCPTCTTSERRRSRGGLRRASPSGWSSRRARRPASCTRQRSRNGDF